MKITSELSWFYIDADIVEHEVRWRQEEDAMVTLSLYYVDEETKEEIQMLGWVQAGKKGGHDVNVSSVSQVDIFLPAFRIELESKVELSDIKGSTKIARKSDTGFPNYRISKYELPFLLPQLCKKYGIDYSVLEKDDE